MFCTNDFIVKSTLFTPPRMLKSISFCRSTCSLFTTLRRALPSLQLQFRRKTSGRKMSNHVRLLNENKILVQGRVVNCKYRVTLKQLRLLVRSSIKTSGSPLHRQMIQHGRQAPEPPATNGKSMEQSQLIPTPKGANRRIITSC
jgi:hypothetical protein